MSVLYISIVFVVLCAGLVGCKSRSTGYYNCEKGVYDTLYHVTEMCREASYTPHLRNLRKNQIYVSGKDVADMFQDYCSVVNDVTDCVEEFIHDLPCLEQELETFRTMNRRSNWFCQDNSAKRIITDIYQDLPMENLNYKSNECYKDAPSKAYACMRRYLNAVVPFKDRRETMKRILTSLRCTFRALHRKCGRNTSLLLTTLEYDWLIIPPALGINISETLIITSNIKFAGQS